MPIVSKSLVSEIFLKDETPATILYTVCIDVFGTDIHEWEPETLWLEIQDEFKVDANECAKDKIQAAITLVATNRFWEEYRVFEAIAKSFNCHSPEFETVTPLSVEECEWAVAEAHLIDETPEEFSDEVKVYVRETLRSNGFIIATPNLGFCNLAKKYPVEKMVPKEFLSSVIEKQKEKLKKVETYVNLQKKRIKKDLAKYFI